MNNNQQEKLANLRNFGSALVNVNHGEDAIPNYVCNTRKTRGVLKIHNEFSSTKLSDFIQPAKHQQSRKPKLERKEKRGANSPSSTEWPILTIKGQEESYCPASVLSGFDSSPNCGYSDILKRNTNIKKVQEHCNSTDSQKHKMGASKVNEFKNRGGTSKQSPKKADPNNLIKNVPNVIEGKIEKSQGEIQCSQKNWQDQRTKSSKTEISKKIKENLKRSDNEILNEESKTKKLTVKSLEDNLQFNDGTVANTEKSNEEQEIIREKRKRRRHIIRARKREQKEAELLQQLRAPKDSKITILSGNALNKFLKPSKLNTKPKVEFSAFTEDFPDLNAVNTVSAPEALEKLKVPITPMAEAETPVQTSIENRKENGIVKEIEEAEKNVGEKKAPKSSDPIQLNLFDIALAKSVLKQKMKEKRSRLQTTKRTSDFDKIIANSLDSNAPILSRGKIRTRQKKTTLMKKAILKQRQERQKLLSVSTGMVAASPRNLSNEAIDGEWLDQPEAIEDGGKIVVVKKKMKKKKRVKILDSNNDEPIRHTNKFREYCDQMLTDDIEIVCVDLLHDLVRFQDRAHQKDPIKAKMKKRLVFGLRETTRQVERGRVKAVVIAPNLEKCNEPGGLDEAVKSLLDQVHKKGVFCVYALDRWRLSKATKKKGMTSCLGILNYQGSNENYKKLQVLVEEARSEYERRSSKNKIMQNVSIEEANTDTSKNSLSQQSPPEISPLLLSLIKMELKD